MRIVYVDDVKRPWWQTAATPRQGFVIGSIWLVLAMLQAGVAIARDRGWPIALAAGFLVLSLGYLVPAELLRRRSG